MLLYMKNLGPLCSVSGVGVVAVPNTAGVLVPKL